VARPPAWFEVLARLPPSAPFAMTTLVGLDAVTWWQFRLSAVNHGGESERAERPPA
jgi:hypothetical protein